jgi:hypothetical protein
MQSTPTPPKTERWVIMMAWAFAPAVAALFVPQSLRVPLFAISGAVFLASFVLMIRHARQERDERR